MLLCEDNQLNAEIAKTLLEERGMTVVCAENGREGFDVFADSEEGGFCAVLMDIRMPVMDGYEATAR
ncbi:MAG TPA: response regulator, partial [Leptospiraceae bacterium]|nr:response regulator [Leptospiraceae bacterium]